MSGGAPCCALVPMSSVRSLAALGPGLPRLVGGVGGNLGGIPGRALPLGVAGGLGLGRGGVLHLARGRVAGLGAGRTLALGVGGGFSRRSGRVLGLGGLRALPLRGAGWLRGGRGGG